MDLSTQRLYKSEELYRELTRNIPGLAVIIFDKEYNYILADGEALDRDDYPPEKIEGKHITDVLGEEKGFYFISMYDKAFKNGDRIKLELEKKDKFYKTEFIPLYNDYAKEYDRGLIVTLDITENKAMEKELEKRLDEITLINTYMDNFVYSVAHDLRSPVANLKAMVNLLNIEKPENIELQEKINRSVNRLDKTLNSLVEVIDVQKNNNYSIEAVNVKTVVDIVKENIKHHIDEVRPNIILNLKENTLLYAEVYMISIIQNLMSNAIKYSSPNRKCTISISTYRDNGYFVLDFKDNGIGIEEEYVDKIFDIFSRLAETAEGRGIGLHLVQSIVEKNGGYIKVESELDKGTRFKINIKEY